MPRQECPECYTTMKKRAKGEWECPSCGVVVVTKESPLWTGYTVDDDDTSDGLEPEGCTACGNPAYPDCIASCSLYDY